MRNYLNSLKKNAGFTLIELLVVIGILGILAAALIATIDPFEQLRKATDANIKNTAVEFVNASTRYYTTHTTLPWADTTITNISGCGSVTPSNSISNVNLNDTTGLCYLNALIADSELKQGFTSITGLLTNIVIEGTSNGATACYKPQSQSGRKDLNAKYVQSAGSFVSTNICPGNGSATLNCYWCSL